MKIYRSMCDKELQSTLSRNGFCFVRRFKWFTPNLTYQERVKEGKFNNSHSCADRYKHLVEFTIRKDDEKNFNKLNRELMLDGRKVNNIKILDMRVLQWTK